MPKQLLDYELIGRFHKDNCENNFKKFFKKLLWTKRGIVVRVNRPTWQSIISKRVASVRLWLPMV